MVWHVVELPPCGHEIVIQLHVAVILSEGFQFIWPRIFHRGIFNCSLSRINNPEFHLALALATFKHCL